mmetsp:Transcript_12606/g.34732  ORF Transcript_12606/g.34732 Transcript_12606/m.34732 type:complete len:98 (-) Transcript_12606:463-756(-)
MLVEYIMIMIITAVVVLMQCFAHALLTWLVCGVQSKSQCNTMTIHSFLTHFLTQYLIFFRSFFVTHNHNGNNNNTLDGQHCSHWKGAKNSCSATPTR